jgi:hypothetical protein
MRHAAHRDAMAAIRNCTGRREAVAERKSSRVGKQWSQEVTCRTRESERGNEPGLAAYARMKESPGHSGVLSPLGCLCVYARSCSRNHCSGLMCPLISLASFFRIMGIRLQLQESTDFSACLAPHRDMVRAEFVRNLPPAVTGFPPSNDLTRPVGHSSKDLADNYVLFDIGLSLKSLCEEIKLRKRTQRDFVPVDTLSRYSLDDTDNAVGELNRRTLAVEPLVVAFGILDRTIHQLVGKLRIVVIARCAINGIWPREGARAPKQQIDRRIRRAQVPVVGGREGRPWVHGGSASLANSSGSDGERADAANTNALILT